MTAFVESVGEPVGLLGWSQGGQLALDAAGRTDAVSALVAYEPAVLETTSEEKFAQLIDAVTRVGELAAEDRQVDAAQSFFEWVATEEEIDEMNDAMLADFSEGGAANVQVFLQEVEGLDEEEGTSPTEAAELAKLAAPVLLLRGERSDPWFINGIHHVAEHVTDAHVREISGTGHMGPIHTPEAVRYLPVHKSVLFSLVNTGSYRRLGAFAAWSGTLFACIDRQLFMRILRDISMG